MRKFKKTCINVLTIKNTWYNNLRKRKKGGVKMFNEQELRVAMVREQKTMKDIADMLEISQTTLYRKIKRDGDFSRKEIQRISEFLKLKEPDKIFFA